MDGLEDALSAINVAYHMNHRKNGKPMFDPTTGAMQEGIGRYELRKFDPEERKAILWSNSPYPSKFEEGVIVQIVRMFKPKDSIRNKITLDETKETRKSGGESNTYLISW